MLPPLYRRDFLSESRTGGVYGKSAEGHKMYVQRHLLETVDSLTGALLLALLQSLFDSHSMRQLSVSQKDRYKSGPGGNSNALG